MSKRSLFLFLLLLCTVLLLPAIACGEPKAPTLAIENEKDTGRVVLRWEKISGASKYQVFRSESEDGEFTQLDTAKTNAYIDYPVELGETFFYYVQAVSGSEVSPASNIESGTKTLALPSLQLSNVYSDGTIRITWKKVDKALSYDLYRSLDGEEWTLLESTEETRYTTEAPEAGIVHYYRLEAVSSMAAATSCSQVKSICVKLPRPELSIETSVHGKPLLSWQAMENAVGYEIYTAKKSKGTFRLAAVTTENSYIHPHAEPGALTYYKVKAIAATPEATSDFSYPDAGRGAYVDVNTISGTLNTDGKPLIWWGRTENDSYYEIYRSLIPDGDFSLLKQVENTYYSNGGAAEGVTYYYKISAFDDNGFELASTDPIAVTAREPQDEVLETRYVFDPKVKLHDIPTSNSPETALRYMTEIQLGKAIITRESGTWYRAFYNDKLYYLFWQSGKESLTSTQSTFQYTSKNPLQQKIIDAAFETDKQRIVYMDGGTGWIDENTLSFDCSGFVAFVLNAALESAIPTYNVPPRLSFISQPQVLYNSASQGEFSSYEVPLSDLQPGDILIFRSQLELIPTNEPGHCSIYLGNQEFMHSTAVWEDSVCIMPLREDFLDTFLYAIRYVPKKVETADQLMVIDGEYKNYKLYEKAANDSAVAATLEQGDLLTLLYHNRSWAYVRTQTGSEGYLLTKHLTAVADQPMVLYGSYQNYKLYEDMSGESAVVATLKQGDRLTLLHSGKKWSLVRTQDGSCGYLLSKHLIASENQPMVINGEYQNYKVYEKMSGKAEAVAKLKQGDLLTLLFTRNENWAYVRTLDGVQGFFPVKHLTACGNEPTVIKGEYQSYKVYEKMSGESAVVAKPKQGDVLTLLHTCNKKWAYVRTADGVEGFFLVKHFGEKDSAAQ